MLHYMEDKLKIISNSISRVVHHTSLFIEIVAENRSNFNDDNLIFDN